jgi:hypothetical protein
MNAEIMRIIAGRQVDEMHSVARAARLARQARDGRASAAQSLPGAGIPGRSARRPRLLARWAPGRPQPT